MSIADKQKQLQELQRRQLESGTLASTTAAYRANNQSAYTSVPTGGSIADKQRLLAELQVSQTSLGSTPERIQIRYNALVDRLNGAISSYGKGYGSSRSNRGIFQQADRDFSSIKSEIESMLEEVGGSDLDLRTRFEIEDALDDLLKATDNASLDARSRASAYTNPATARIMQQEDEALYFAPQYESYERMLQSMPNRLEMQDRGNAYDSIGGASSYLNSQNRNVEDLQSRIDAAQDYILAWKNDGTDAHYRDLVSTQEYLDALQKELKLAKDTQTEAIGIYEQLSASEAEKASAAEKQAWIDRYASQPAQTLQELYNAIQGNKRELDRLSADLSNFDGGARAKETNARIEELQSNIAEFEGIYNTLRAQEMEAEAKAYRGDVPLIEETANPFSIYGRINADKLLSPGDVLFGTSPEERAANRAENDVGEGSPYDSYFNEDAYITEEQKRTYNYLAWQDSINGTNRADEYYSYIQSELERTRTQTTTENVSAFTEEHPYFASAVSVAMKPVEMLGAAEMLGRAVIGMPTNTDTALSQFSHTVSTTRATAPEAINWTGDTEFMGQDLDSWIYGTVTSGLDSIVAASLGGAIGGSSTAALSKATSAIMGMEMLPSTVISEKQKGRSDEEALIIGILRSMIEGITEKYSIEAIFKNPTNLLSTIRKGIVAEGSEEMASNVLNAALDIITNDPESIKAQYEKLVAYGIDKNTALSEVLTDAGKQLLLDGLAGAVTGAGLGGSAYIMNAAAVTQQENQLTKNLYGADNYAQLLAEAEEAVPNSPVLKKLTDKGGRISASSATKLRKEVETAQTKKDAGLIRSAVAEELAARGGTNTDNAVADAIAKVITAQEVAAEEVQLIRESEHGADILNEMRGLQGSERDWVQDLNKKLKTVNLLQPSKKESRAPRVTVRNADATTKSGDSVQILGLQAQDDGKVSVKVRGTNGAESVVAASELTMSEESQDLVEGVAEFKGAAPAVYAAYMPTNDVDIFLKDAAFVSTMAQSVAASNKNDGSAMLRYLKDSRLVSNLADIQIDTIFEATLAEAKKTLSSAQGKKTSGKGNFTWNVETRSEESLRGREATAVRFMRNLAAIYPDIDIEIFESDKKNGKYQGEQGSYRDGKIRIDLNAGKYSVDDQIESAMLRTLSHELTHHLQRTAPKQYAALKAFITEHLAEWNGGKKLDMLITSKQLRSRDGLSYAAAMDEVVADACEMMLKNSKAIQHLAAENKSLFAKIRDFVKKFLSDLRRAFAGVEATDAAAKYLQKFEAEMQQLWDAAVTASVQNAKTATAEKAQKNSAPEGTQFAERNVGGKKIVWVENSPLSNRQLKNHADVAAYIAQHIGEVYTILESGQKVYIGNDLPSEYTQSKYTTHLLNSDGKTLKAKNKAVGVLGNMIEIATNRRWEKTKHPWSKDAKYGIYRYDSSFAFPVKDRTGKVVGVYAYDVNLLIRNASDGKKYLYDMVQIQEDTSSGLSLSNEETRRAANMTASRGSASRNKVPQSTPKSQSPTQNNSGQNSDRDYEAAEIARLEQRIEQLEQGKVDAFLAGQMRTARQAGKETRRLEEKIDTLKGKLDEAKQTAKDTRKANAEERKAADLRAKNLEAQIKKLGKDLAKEYKQDLEAMRKEYRQQLTEYRERRNESESKSYYRERVFKRIRDMQDMLITNSDKKHVPEMLKEPLGNFLLSLHTSSVTKLEGKGETKRDVDMYRRAEQLKKALERARNNTESGGYLDLPDEFMERFDELSDMIHEITSGVDAVSSDPISRMNSSQLKDLNFVLRVLQKSINDMNRMLATARFHTVAEAAESTITELDQILEYQMKGKGAEALRGTINWKNTTPVYAFDRMGEAGKELFKAMWEAQGEFAFHTSEILDTRKGIVSDKQVREWSQDVQTIQLSDNRRIRMTTAQMMAFYCLTKRQQALDHLKTGGIRISNIEYGRNHIQQARAYHLSADDIVKIANMVKGDAKRVADQLQQYMTERGSEWGNQISMARFGYRAFTEPVYFPIRTESSQIAKDTKSTQENSINRLLNMSFTKSTQPNASTSVVVDNIFDVFSAHMSDMAKYNAFALPVLDMIKWFDYNVQERLEDGVQKDHRAVKTSIESAYGKDALNYISTFLEDVNGANEGGRVRGAHWSQKLISHYKAASVGANLRVAIQQPTSYWRAAAVLDPKYLAVGEKVMWHNAKKYYKEMSEYAGIAAWKELGFRDFNVGRSVREQIAGTLSASAQAYDKVMDASMKLASLADTWTWCRIWEACKAEVKATQKLSGEELMHATADRFNEVIARTQVVDSVMTRSHTMRSKNLLDQLMTPFMAEPTLSYNVVASSVFDYRTEIRRSNRQIAWKKYGKRMIRAFGVFVATAFWTGVFQSLADALRDDDDYEEFYKKFLDAMLPKGLPKGKFNEDPMKWIEEALDQGNFLANMNIASNIPGLHRELLNVLKGFGSEAMWTAGISNLYNAVAAVYEKIALEAGWMEEATDVTWNGNMTWWGAIQKSLQSASQISSLPIYNLLRDATALYNTTVQEFFGRQDIKLLSYDPGTEGRVANAYADGFLTFDEAMGEMQKFGVSQHKAYETLMKSAGFGKYDELREAIVNGGDVNAVMEKLTGYGIKEDLVTSSVKSIIKDMVMGTDDEPPMIDKKTAKNLLIQYLGMTVPEAHYTVEAYGEENFSKYGDLRDAILNGGDVQTAMDELTEYGTKESDVLSEIRASIKVWYQGETKDDGTVVDPVIDKDRAVELLVQYGDRDEDEAAKLVNEWSLTVDTGVKDIKESFIAGDLTTDEAIDYRMTYFGQSEEDASQTVAEWIFEDEYGFSYSERIGQFKDGNLSADELVDVMVEYGGKTEKEAKTSVAGYAKEAYADGQFSYDEAISVMTNAGGMTRDDADKKLRYIDVSAQFPDITIEDAWVNEYYEDVESSGITLEVFIGYRNDVRSITGEGKKERRMDVINSLPVSNTQKDALYYAEGWAASKIWEAPWH